jgi:hypothetical protein
MIPKYGSMFLAKFNPHCHSIKLNKDLAYVNLSRFLIYDKNALMKKILLLFNTASLILKKMNLSTTTTTFDFVAEHFPAYLPFLAQQYWNSPTPTRLEIHWKTQLFIFTRG